MPQPPRAYLKESGQVVGDCQNGHLLEGIVDVCLRSLRQDLLKQLGASGYTQTCLGIETAHRTSSVTNACHNSTLHTPAQLNLDSKAPTMHDSSDSEFRLLVEPKCSGRANSPPSPGYRNSLMAPDHRVRGSISNIITDMASPKSHKEKSRTFTLEMDPPSTPPNIKAGPKPGNHQTLHSVLENARRVHNHNSKVSEEIKLDRSWWTYFRNPEREQIFDIIVAVIIMLNVAQIGVSTDVGKGWKGWLVLDTFFATAFAFEFCFKLWLHGYKQQLCGKMWAGSYFDIFIVSLAVGELILNVFFATDDDSGGVGFSVFRIVRLCRLTRILKILRLPVFKDLLAMIDGLIYGSRTLFWSMCLLGAPIYSMAIMMRETVGNQDETPDNFHYVAPFKSFPWSFFTCFRCIMGDCSTETGQPIFVLLSQNLGGAYGVGFSVILSVTTFGLFNVIIAIYVDNIQVAAKRSESAYLAMRLQDEDKYNALMGHLVTLLISKAKRENSDSSSVTSLQEVSAVDAASIELSREDFMVLADTEDVQYVFDELDILPENRVGLFDALDADGGGSLSLMEILNGLRMLRGEPRRADTIANYIVLRNMQERYDDDKTQLHNAMNDLKRSVVELREQARQSRRSLAR